MSARQAEVDRDRAPQAAASLADMAVIGIETSETMLESGYCADCEPDLESDGLERVSTFPCELREENT